MMKRTPVLAGRLSLSAIFLAALVAACGSRPVAIDPEAHDAAAGRNSPLASDFPPIESAIWKDGAFPSKNALRQMHAGMSKDQVRDLLSWPHFSEGFVGVREWNYIFHFRLAKGHAYKTCQYMVRFDQTMRTTGAYWKSADCEVIAKLSSEEILVKPVAQLPARPSVPQRISLRSDTIFRVDGAASTDLLSEGQHMLELLAGEIKRGFRSVKSISVTVNSDRSDSGLPDVVARARADAVRDQLIRRGIDATVMHVSVAGSRQPHVKCPEAKGSVVSACAEPNGRIEIEVVGEY